MAYFDSPKNRAMWERTLSGLREERERRKATGYAPQSGEAKQEVQTNPFRRQINLAQLEEIEREASGIRRVRRPVRQVQKSMEPSMEREAVTQRGRSR